MNAKNDFSYVISGYKEELRRNPKARLATYCRSLGVNDDSVHHWMEKYGLPRLAGMRYYGLKGTRWELIGCEPGCNRDEVRT